MKTSREIFNELWDKPKSEKFTPEEIGIIKKYVPKWKYKARYAIYKPVSKKDIYIGFFLDSDPYATRRSGVENHWNFLYERNITNIEYQEIIQNYGCNNSRFHTYQYKHIEHLVLEDQKYNVTTPPGFVKECKRLGYTGDFQLQINFF